MANQSVEVIWARSSRCRSGSSTRPAAAQVRRPSAWATRAVCSSGVPSGILMTTCNSLLLSNGSIFTRTSPSGTNATETRSNRTTPTKNSNAIARGLDQRCHDAAIERWSASSPSRALVAWLLLKMSAQQTQGRPGRNNKGNHQREQASPPKRRRGWAACTGPSGRAQTPWAVPRQSRRMWRELLDCRLRQLPRQRLHSSAGHDSPEAGSGAPCFRPRRWRHPRECRCEKISAKSVTRLMV